MEISENIFDIFIHVMNYIVMTSFLKVFFENLFFINFYWSTVSLQCCVSFCCMAK